MSKTVSYHIFMFPFIFEDKKKIKKGWEFVEYEGDYNEKAYFYKFFKDSMFSKDEKNANSALYTKKEYNGADFFIKKSKEYRLKLEKINLRLFSTGVGILSFHVNNTEYKDIKDILEINDYGRRVYAEYLDDDLNCALVPEYIQLKDIKENFTYTEKPKEIKLSKIITAFLPQDSINSAVDDRMFVISYYINELFSSSIKKDYISSSKWYEYVFVDGNGITIQNANMQKRLIEEASYPRWQEDYGTLYGISRYSFVCLASDDFALSHIKTMYFQIFSLLLMLKATVLKFSKEVSDIANKIDKEDTPKEVQDLYKRYIKFVNNFYFREITAKDQGLELYEQATKILQIEKKIKDLDEEIAELNSYVELVSEKKRNKTLDILTYLGAFLLFPSIVTGFFGMNGEDIKSMTLCCHKGWIVSGSFLLVPIAIWIYKKFTKDKYE